MCGIVGISLGIVPGRSPKASPPRPDHYLVLVNPPARAYKEILPMMIPGFSPAHTGDDV